MVYEDFTIVGPKLIICVFGNTPLTNHSDLREYIYNSFIVYQTFRYAK